MNKTKIYTLIFAVLLAVVAYTLYSKSAKDKEAKKFKTFKVEDFEKVTLIKFSDTNDKKMSLKKTDKGWILNDKYPVRKHLFEEMKEALTKMEVFNTAPIAAQENAINEIMQHDIKVEIYEGDNKLIKTIHVGGPNFGNSASNMILEIDGKTSPYVYEVGIPGFRGYLTGRFLINEKEWRSKEIFTYTPNDIKEISINYYKNEDKSFSLKKEKENFELEFNNTKYSNERINQKAVVNLLVLLEKQDVLSYSFEKQEEQYKKDSLVKVNKFADIKIVDNENNERKFTIIEMPLNERSMKQYDAEGYPLPFDLDFKYIAIHPTNDWGIISKDKFGKMFVDPKSLINLF